MTDASVNITDSHFHLWDRRRFGYDWLAEAPLLDRDFLPEDYRQATASMKIERSVFVEAYVNQQHCVGESQWVVEEAETHPWLAGVVGAAYVESDESNEQLKKLTEYGLVKGIRRLFDEEPDENFAALPEVIRGVEKLAEYNLSFDICIRCTQLAGAIELVRQSAGVRFVLDHCGKPNIKDEQWQPWADEIAELASYDNVWCKMSGLVTEAGAEKSTTEHLKPYIDHVIASFGFYRLMFGSDWPVCTLAAEPTKWLMILHEALGSISDADSHRLFQGTCEQFYRL